VLATLLCYSTSAVRAEVVIEGVSGHLEENVRAQLRLADLECDAPAWLVRWQYRAVVSDATAALEALGYYSASVESRLEVPSEGCWRAHIKIVRGPSVRVATVRVDVSGRLADEPEMRGAIVAAQAMVDARLDHSVYERNKRALADVARDLGYFDARMTRSELRVNATERRADIAFEIDGGERFRFGVLTMSEGVLGGQLMRSFAPFREGDAYRADLVDQLQRNLNGSGYFSQVIVTAEPSLDDSRTVPVSVEVTPLPRRWVYGVGLGYATDTGVRLRADAENPRLNQRGHRVDVKTMVSDVRSDIDATYRMPHRDPMRNWFSFGAAAAREETSTQRSDIVKFSARHSYDRLRWLQVDFVELNFEDFEIAGQSDESRLVLVGSMVSRVWRDDPFKPRRGLRLSATARGATQQLGSDTDFAQLRLFGRAVQGLTPSTRLLVRGEAGWTWKDEFSDLPPSVRFFAGGDTSVRGYDYQSLGPTVDGEVVGGSGLLTGSVELDWSFLERWAVAAFVDSGSAYDRTPSFSTGVGAGVRWFSPLGAIRFDIAHPLDDPDRSVRLHVTLGPDL
jgi:translocation and assembly module TamA